jgi:large subunit ribosomal protein L6
MKEQKVTKRRWEETLKSIRLQVKGVGWRVERKGSTRVLHLGYSHPIEVAIPSERKVRILQASGGSGSGQGGASKGEGDTELLLVSKDGQGLGDFVASLIRYRPWNVYTGQGLVRRDRSGTRVRKVGKQR